jgi:hypothetical protein
MRKHVLVLEDAELLTTEQVGRARRCRLGPGRLDDVHPWTEMYRPMLDERPRVTTTSTFHTTPERDGMPGSGMARELNETYPRLDELLGRSPPS